MPQLGPGSPIFFTGFSRQMKRAMIVHALLGCGFLYVVYRLGLIQPLRRLFAGQPSRWDVLSNFPEVKGDAALVTWYHAANSRRSLKDAVRGPYMMVEADILIGSDGKVIMAHPPAVSSDLPYDLWLRSLKHMAKGLKLDFKSPAAVLPCLAALSAIENELKGPVIINADILQGPNSDKKGLEPSAFISTVKKHYPQALLSIGWTTGDGPAGYSWDDVYRMFMTVKKNGLFIAKESALGMKITFPVRASLMHAGAVKKLLWLLEMVPDSSLTVFGSAQDKRKAVDDLLLLRYLVPKQALFMDIAQAYPRDHLKSFNASMNDLKRLHSRFSDFHLDQSNLREAWDLLGGQEGQYLLTSHALIHSGGGVGLVSQKELVGTIAAQTNFRLTFHVFSKHEPAPKCLVELVLRSTTQLTNDLITPPGIVCRLDLPSGRLAIQASGDRDAAMVEERLDIPDGAESSAHSLAYRLSVLDDGQRVAFVASVLSRYDETEPVPKTSKRLVLANKLNSDAPFRATVIVRCFNSATNIVLHDVKV